MAKLYKLWDETIELDDGNVIKIDYEDNGKVEFDTKIDFDALEWLLQYIKERKRIEGEL